MTLRIPPELHERLRKLAFDRRVSINSLVVAFIVAKIAEIDAAPTPERGDQT